MGSLVRARISATVVEVLNEMAVKHMGIKSEKLISQSLGYHEGIEAVFFYININTDDTVVELMYPDPIYGPENGDDVDVVDTICAAFQIDRGSDRAEVVRLLEEAKVIYGK